ncbi:hypothetical protein OC842_006365 [Tilletia horrida]|uniref:Uncharacterized protein n=1 Tax=Tilletia horrida TaxID=155126 RepID=A0AAN6G615_9BASI|nr:hypothetical protein OC842_006365 [Tilletia horrida]
MSDAHYVGCFVIFAAAIRLLIRCGTIRAAQYGSNGETSADDKNEYTDPDGEEKQDGVDKAQKSASLAPLAGAVASITQKIDAFIENIVGVTVQDRNYKASSLSSATMVEDLRGDIPLATRYQLLERLRQEVAVYNNGLAMSTLYGHRNHCLSLEAEASNFFRVAWAADGQAVTINGDLVRLTDLRVG